MIGIDRRYEDPILRPISEPRTGALVSASSARLGGHCFALCSGCDVGHIGKRTAPGQGGRKAGRFAKDQSKKHAGDGQGDIHRGHVHFPRTWASTKWAAEMTWSVAALACLGQDLGNGTENGEVGMVGGQSMGQLLSQDSGARAWKHASRSAAATP